MNIKIIVSKNNNYEVRHEMEIDGKIKYSVGSLSECPEDAIIGRSLIDCYDLLEAIKLGYKIGKDNGTIEIEEIKK
ncbi:MAG: hypothetical protein AABY22_33885 [Nanoarchaeota archaeon]